MAANRADLDRILEEGLAGYPNAEPLAGIEDRILARIGATQTPRPSYTLFALALAACVVGLALFLLPTRQPLPSNVGRPAPAVPPLPVRPATAAHASEPTPARRFQAAALRKRRVFPTPSPVTSQEHLLLLLAAKDPDQADQAFASLRRAQDEPLEIAPLVIPPLAAGGQN
jgi:hypothetical protein